MRSDTPPVFCEMNFFHIHLLVSPHLGGKMEKDIIGGVKKPRIPIQSLEEAILQKLTHHQLGKVFLKERRSFKYQT